MTDFNPDPYPAKRSIRISDRELATPQQKAEFLKLVGPKQYERLVHQFAVQRVPPEKPGGFTPEQIGQMSPTAYEDHREAIQADLNAVAGPDEEVFGEFIISETQLNSPVAKDKFHQLFGFDRFMQALGLEDAKELNGEAYHKALGREYRPHGRRVTPGSSNAFGDLDKRNVNVAGQMKSDHSWTDKAASDKSEAAASDKKGDKPE